MTGKDACFLCRTKGDEGSMMRGDSEEVLAAKNDNMKVGFSGSEVTSGSEVLHCLHHVKISVFFVCFLELLLCKWTLNSKEDHNFFS